MKLLSFIASLCIIIALSARAHALVKTPKQDTPIKRLVADEVKLSDTVPRSLRHTITSVVKRHRELLQNRDDRGVVIHDADCPAECHKNNFRCKRRKTALLLSIFMGFYGVDRFYLGYVFYGFIKVLAAVFGCCLPLCHFYIFGFHASKNVNKIKKEKKLTPTQKFCRCNNRKCRLPCYCCNIPLYCCRHGNPIYCFLFTWFLIWYMYDIYHIAKGDLVDQFNKNPVCYLQKL